MRYVLPTAPNVEDLFRCHCAKNYRNRLTFDQVIAKTKRLQFFETQYIKCLIIYTQPTNAVPIHPSTHPSIHPRLFLRNVKINKPILSNLGLIATCVCTDPNINTHSILDTLSLFPVICLLVYLNVVFNSK